MWSTSRLYKIGGDDINDFLEYIRNLLHANIDILTRRLIDEFPGDGVKYVSKIQSHCVNMNFSDKIRYGKNCHQVIHKEGEFAMKYIKRFQN